MKRALLLTTALLFTMPYAIGLARADAPVARTDAGKPSAKPDADKAEPPQAGRFTPTAVETDGSVTVGGQKIDYQAVAGTLVVHPKGWDDVPKAKKDEGEKEDADDDHNPTAEASMFYVAYFAKGGTPGARPVTFFFNGGPGSSTVWLHMGAFGPKRVVTLDDTHTPAAPYNIVNNDQSLLDSTDMVFVDAPGTGFSRIAGKNKEKAFWGIDADANAFAEFVAAFISKYDRWNSPKYLFGESYGTTRAAVLSNKLQLDRSIDLNGIIMLSQILNWGLSPDGAEGNPGLDMAYQVALPTYAATAWYHKKLPNQTADLPALLREVEHFAMTDYGLALGAGATLDPAKREEITQKLHAYTGLPEAYIKKANLRIEGGEFTKTLLDDTDTTTGRLDTRFSGPSMDPLSKEADYDPQSAAISSAYVSAFNHYAHDDLKYGATTYYKPEIDVFRSWSFAHQGPGQDMASPGTPNVMADLATAMKYNPGLKVQLNAGFFDLATPYYEGVFEMQHLPIPAKLQSNIEFKQYASGHMVYAHASALKELHDNVAGFIARTDNHR